MVKLLLICVLVTLSISANVSAEDEWWEYGHFYQVYPRSFQDSDGDGIGDINGITSRLPYLKGIGVTGIWLSPIFKSPMKDFGYDISDFKAIQPEYGTMEDFENLSKRCKELDIKLILDYVPNHCSSEHEWFKKALDRNHPEHEKYKNYFIWNKGKLSENGTRLPPSNWLSIFRGSAWQYVEDLEAYYLHQFLEEQPDLNFRNQELVEEMKDVLRFWLKKGANGFRIDAIPFIYESKENADGFYDDEPRSGECNDDPDASCYLNHTQTKDQDETYEMLYQWREVMEEPQFADVTRILMVEGYTSFDMTMKYYGEIKNGEIVRYGAQMPFNFMLMSNTWSGTGTYGYVENIVKLLDNLPKGDRIRANWVLGNHDNKRIASRNRPSRIDLFNIMLKTLPGIAVTYYGEEIGMTNVFISWEDTVDPQACRTNPDIYEGFSRDPERTPFQWDDTKNAGFSTGDTTWLPVALNYTECNVNLQESLARSHLKVFRQLMELRENPTFKYGKLQIQPVDTEVLVYKREIEDDADADVFVVVLNLETSFKSVDLTRHLSALPDRLEVVTSSTHATLNVGDIVDAKKMEISPEAGVVLKGIKEFK